MNKAHRHVKGRTSALHPFLSNSSHNVLNAALGNGASYIEPGSGSSVRGLHGHACPQYLVMPHHGHQLETVPVVFRLDMVRAYAGDDLFFPQLQLRHRKEMPPRYVNNNLFYPNTTLLTLSAWTYNVEGMDLVQKE